MTRRQWRDPHSAIERHYGLGIAQGKVGDWEWFGHGGAFQGFISRTAVLSERGVTVSIVTNAIDGQANQWSDGVIQILQAGAANGAPRTRIRGWAGRWWSIWTALDLVPMGDKVLVAAPALLNPFMDASEIAVTGRDRGEIALANGYGVHGETVRRLRAGKGQAGELWLGGGKYLPEGKLAAEMRRRYKAH